MTTDPENEAIARRVVEAYRSVRLDRPLSAIVSPAQPPRGPRILAVTAAAAATVLIVTLGWWVRSGVAGVPPTGGPGPEITASLRPTTTVSQVTEQELRTWVASLPSDSRPEVPRLIGHPGSFALVAYGHQVAVPTDVVGDVHLIDTRSGVLAWLPTEPGSDIGLPVSYVELLEPSGRLIPLAHGAMSGMALDPTGRFGAWQEAVSSPGKATRVTLLDLSTRSVVALFDTPADARLAGWATSGLVFQQPSGILVHTVNGNESTYPAIVAEVSGDRAVIVDEGDCRRVMNLATGTRGPQFACPAPRQASPGDEPGATLTPVVALTRDGTWLLVDGVAVEADTLTVRHRLLPAGFPFRESTKYLIGFRQVGQTELLTTVLDQDGPVVVTAVCDLPTGQCRRLPDFGSTG